MSALDNNADVDYDNEDNEVEGGNEEAAYDEEGVATEEDEMEKLKADLEV